MSSPQSATMARPSLGYRSISEQAPLYDPSANPYSGSRLRDSKAASGAQTATGSVLPFSPLLPLPPATTSKHQGLHQELYEANHTENVTPSHDVRPSSLATRRQARRGVSEDFGHPEANYGTCHGRPEITLSPAPGLAPKKALRLDIGAASDLYGHPAASKSAGMIRSYSMPVATQQEHDEQQRIMALGLSPVGRYASNSAWWQYGWPSPGGVNHRHLQFTALPEFVGERRNPSQSKLTSGMAPASVAAGSSTSRTASRSSKTHSSCSPKLKAKHLPSIHQHTPRSASSSPKMGCSPLAMMSTNLPSIDQQECLELNHDAKPSNNNTDDVTPAEAAFDIEMDTLNARFAEWTRSQSGASTVTPVGSHAIVQDADYFNLAHDDASHHTLIRGNGGSDTSDEARTPRASSPRPLSKAASEHQARGTAAPAAFDFDLDFIHPDHLA